MIFKPVFEKLFQMREAASRMRKEQLRPGADNGYDPYEKPFLDHLEDLRKTLGKMLTILFVATLLAFIFNVQIFEFVQLPAKLATMEDGSRLWDHVDFLTLSPQEILMLSIKTAFFAALIFSFPILVWLAGEFIMPGLKQREKRLVLPGVTIGFVLFLTGASFAFFMASPIALKFFYGFYLERVGVLSPHATADVGKLYPVQYLPGTEPKVDGETSPEGSEAVVPPKAEKPAIEGETGTEENAGPDASAVEAQSPALPAPPAAAPDVPQLDPEMKLAVREYLRNLLVVEEGSKLAIYFDPVRDKMILTSDTSKSVSYRIGEYINFITRLTLVFGLSFQLPVVVTILVKLELLTARVMRSTRAYAWVVMLVAAAIFTPPDVFTLALLAGPLIILYEICIWIAWFIENKRERLRRKEEEERQSRLVYLQETPAEDLSEEEKEELHQYETEQYEKEHAHLYEEESNHVAHDPEHSEENDDYYSDYGYDHDESWIQDQDHHSDGEPTSGEAEDSKDQDSQDKPDNAGDDPGETDSDSEEDDLSSPDSEDDDSWEKEEGVCEPSGPVVNLNTATLEEIEDLPGMGNEMANIIIDHRPYFTFDDLTHIPGMDDDLLNGMIDRLSVDEGAD